MTRFVVSRTSIPGNTQPCEEAFAVEKFHIQRHSIEQVELGVSSDGVTFFAKGRNHRMEDGGWVREIPYLVWMVEFNSPEDIAAFTRKYGECCITDGFQGPEIEIRDATNDP